MLKIATKDKLFQFNGDLYKQIDGIAMCSPLGSLLANTFMCFIEEKLAHEDKLPDFYKGYIDDILALVPDLAAATDFLSVLNDAHSAIQFTMKTEKRPTKGFYSIIRAILTIDNI